MSINICGNDWDFSLSSITTTSAELTYTCPICKKHTTILLEGW